MENKSKQKTIWKVWPGMKSHPWNFKDPKVVENVELALIYRQVKKICRKCYSKLPPNAAQCRNKKCHCNDLRYAHNCRGAGGSFVFDFYIPDKKTYSLKKVNSN